MIYLASRSPRRAELLRQIGVEFEVRSVNLDESRSAGEDPDDYVRRLAAEKAMAVRLELSDTDGGAWILAADTTISLEGDIIGKPADRRDCRRILEKLSARQHEVLTAVALSTPRGMEVRLNRNRVRFRCLTKEEIASYCALGEPMDKAGAYAIQGIAAVFIEFLEGSYSGVMGLPLFETAQLLREAGLEII